MSGLQRDFSVAEVGGGAVAQLMQVETGVFVQQDAGAVVAEAGVPGVRADVGGSGTAGGHRAAFGQKQRAASAGAAVGQSEQQVGGAGLPAHPRDGDVLGADGSAPVLQVEVFDVEGEDFRGSGRRFVEHPPQGPFAQRDVAA